MKTSSTINSALLIGKQIEFTAQIENLEGYAEAGMRAVIESISLQGDKDPCYHLMLNYSVFDEYNKAFESKNYFDKNHVPSLSAREAGYYSLKEEFVFDEEEDIYKYFTLLNEENITFIQQKFEESKEENYVDWLEKQFLLAHGKTI